MLSLLIMKICHMCLCRSNAGSVRIKTTGQAGGFDWVLLGRRAIPLHLSELPPVSTIGVWSTRNLPPQREPFLWYFYYTLIISWCKLFFVAEINVVWVFLMSVLQQIIGISNR